MPILLKANGCGLRTSITNVKIIHIITAIYSIIFCLKCTNKMIIPICFNRDELIYEYEN